MKKLLMLGLPRSSYSKERCIEEAVDMGIHLYVADNEQTLRENKTFLSHYSSHMTLVPYKKFDMDQLAKLCTDEKIHNVFSLTEFQLENAAQLRDRLNFYGNCYDVVLATRDKYRTRHLLTQHGLSHIRYHSCRLDQLPQVYQEHKYTTCIVKPKKLTGSIGVRLIHSLEDLRAYIEQAQQHSMLSTNVDYLLEEFIEGKEFSVEGIVSEGNLHMFGITEKFTTGQPDFMETGHRFPIELAHSEQEKVSTYIADCVHALGICYSPIHAELKIHKGTLTLIEIHTRYAGGLITRLVSQAYSIKLYELFYGGLLKDFHYPNLIDKEIYQIKFFTAKDGILTSIDYHDEALLSNENIDEIVWTSEIGSLVKAYPHSLARVGYIIWKSNNIDELEDIEKNIDQNITLNIKGDQQNEEL